jgi:predicted unusual protein kinase regulating ubiquinone biosynthesis (AarF/ABC1/UbiB family)
MASLHLTVQDGVERFFLSELGLTSNDDVFEKVLICRSDQAICTASAVSSTGQAHRAVLKNKWTHDSSFGTTITQVAVKVLHPRASADLHM